MKNLLILDDFLFKVPVNLHEGTSGSLGPTSFAGTGTRNLISHDGHTVSSFPSIPGASAAASAAKGLTSAAKSSGSTLMKMSRPSSMNPNGYNQYPDPEAQGINPASEISRINTNIAIYSGVIAASAIGIGITMCLFVRSIYKAPKGVHGGDSDDEMESESDDDSDGSDDS